MTGLLQLIPGNDDLVDRCELRGNLHGRNRIRFSLSPELIHFRRIGAETDAVNAPIRRQDADGNRDVVPLTLSVDGLLKQECLAVFLFDAATKLPAHQGVHLLVFVDRFFDPDQQTFAFKLGQVVVQVRIPPPWNGRIILGHS